ncbi:MAG: PKD domain-containing protein, partial [Bacteroidota bacterium]
FYDAPINPTDFDVMSIGAFCSNSPLQFGYALEAGIADVATYSWDFAGEGSSSDSSPSFTFTDSGSKLVSLTISIPGCTSDTFSKEVIIESGPTVDFEYTNNCFGEPVVFDGIAVGIGIDSYLWDFGDGSGTSTEEDPSYQYLAGGTYTVSLTVENTTGCSTTYTEDLIVNDQALVSYSFGEIFEQLEATFTGEDLTNSLDSIVSWSWDFGGLGSSTDRVSSFVFPSPGSYDVELQITTAQGCNSVISESVSVLMLPCPVSSFSLVDELCIAEELGIENESLASSSYRWDFCSGDLENSPTVTRVVSNSVLNRVRSFKLIETNGVWYGFGINSATNRLIRFDFGTDLNSVPDISTLEVDGGFINSSFGFDIVESSGIWYLFIINSGNGSLVRLDFSDGIESDPEAILLNTYALSGTLNDLVIEQSGDDYYGFITDGDQLKR